MGLFLCISCVVWASHFTSLGLRLPYLENGLLITTSAVTAEINRMSAPGMGFSGVSPSRWAAGHAPASVAPLSALGAYQVSYSINESFS